MTRALSFVLLCLALAGCGGDDEAGNEDEGPRGQSCEDAGACRGDEYCLIQPGEQTGKCTEIPAGCNGCCEEIVASCPGPNHSCVALSGRATVACQ